MLLLAGGIGAGFYSCLSTHPAARIAPPEPVPDTGPLPTFPDDPGTACGRKAVELVRAHPGREAPSLGAAAKTRLEELSAKRGEPLRVIGWRGREDHDRSEMCRVSLRFMLGDERGASVWLVDTAGEPSNRIEPQDTLSIEVTGRIPFDDESREKTLRRRCRTKGIELVQRHFSYNEEYGVWGTMRKQAAREAYERDIEIVWGHWKGVPEGSERCLVSVDYTEDGESKIEYWRMRWLPNDEHAVEPLTPRAIESIYGPGVYSR